MEKVYFCAIKNTEKVYFLRNNNKEKVSTICYSGKYNIR